MIVRSRKQNTTVIVPLDPKELVHSDRSQNELLESGSLRRGV
jgi:hypothetical protein